MKDVNNVKAGMRVKTSNRLGSSHGILADYKYHLARKESQEGVVKNFVGGHGGDVWFVEHDDGSVAIYSFTEFDKI